jgi:RNase H-like domain found in reverse transcriptase/Reverse transcriptase (RNA-dependent DNA polymerase)/Integrase zinc binding domain/PHD-finger/Integrase core domain/C-5 cytosine-specific DNA methylase
MVVAAAASQCLVAAHQQHSRDPSESLPNIIANSSAEQSQCQITSLAVAATVTGTSPEGHLSVLPAELYEKDPDNGWTWGNHPDMTPAEQQALRQVVAKHRKSFAYHMKDIVGYRGLAGPFTVKLDTTKPIFSKARRYSVLENQIADEKCTELLEAGIIVPAPIDTQYASATTMPAKKDVNGNWTDKRLCIDYRALNKHTIADKYGMHHPEDLFKSLGDSVFFSKIDLRAGFHQIPIAEKDQPTSSFWWKHKLYMYTRCSFGMRNTSAFFCRVMDVEIAAAGLTAFCVAFIDDILIHSVSAKEHVGHVDQVLGMLYHCGLRAHPDKSVFGAAVIEYLGHNVSAYGLTPHEAKVSAIRNLRNPQNVSELRSVLGFMGYYRCYVPNYSTIAAPLNALLAKDVPWQWQSTQQAAYQLLKDSLCKEGRALKRYDPSRQLVLYTDWSHHGIGAVLTQNDEHGQEYIVACISRSLNSHERNYSSYQGELLGVVWAVKTLRPYLHGVSFVIVTDHRPLLWLMAATDLTGKHARWSLSLSEYSFEIKHRAGKKHQNADVPSRFPQPSSVDVTGARLDEVEPTNQSTAIEPKASALAALYTCSYTHLDAAIHAAALDSIVNSVPVSTYMDAYAPTMDQLLQSTAGILSASGPSDAANEPAAEHTAALHRQAVQWVSTLSNQLHDMPAIVTHQLQAAGPADESGIRIATRLNTTIINNQFYTAAQTEGVVLFELFAGMCAGLDALLSTGVKVSRYFYCDVDPTARAVAVVRLSNFCAQYPNLLPLEAITDAFQCPQDVRDIYTPQLLRMGALDQKQWLVVAGFECQDLSAAGTCQGLDGPRSRTFYDVVRIIGALQQLQTTRLPGYLIENTAMQYNFNSKHIREITYPRICAAIGDPVCIDAARFGSRAHRLRNWWTNLADAQQLQYVCDQVVRPAGLFVNDILDPGRTAQLAQRSDRPPFYECNIAGQALQALPTLMAYVGSRSFCGQRQGMLWDANSQQFSEPNINEREHALGYPVDATAAEGVSLQQRHVITGRCMDGNSIRSLMAIIAALHAQQRTPAALICADPPVTALQKYMHYGVGAQILLRTGWKPNTTLKGNLLSDMPYDPTITIGQVSKEGVGYNRVLTEILVQPWEFELPSISSMMVPYSPSVFLSVLCDLAHDHQQLCVLSSAAHHEEVMYQPSAATADIWHDEATLQYLRAAKFALNTPEIEQRRILRRAKLYRFVAASLHRLMKDGSHRIVPPCADRISVVQQIHARTGHFGVKRTRHLVLHSYWWKGVEQDVLKVIKSCEVCARVNTSFSVQQPELQPLPIMGMFYRWGVDLCGPLPKSSKGNTYCMIAIEYFSKQLEVVPLPDKTADHTTRAFLANVLARYGACAEVLTDNGSEWKSSFHDLLQQAFIDHRVTSPNHPQADGLAERAVQTVKRALQKHCASTANTSDWDQQVYWIALGYRCSRQAATGRSPYEMLFGATPIIPPAIKQRVAKPLDLSNAEEASAYMLTRAELLKQHCIIAMSNQQIAQHRDTERYRYIRSGSYLPRLRKFHEGDFVYAKRRNLNSTLQTDARPGIYRVAVVKESGVLVLQGKCGGTFTEHCSNCAPCHLAGIDPTVDPSLYKPDVHFPCHVCGLPDDEHIMLLCDACSRGYHLYCLTPKLLRVPRTPIWLCPECISSGITPADVLAQQQNQSTHEQEPVIFPSAAQQRLDDAAEQLHDRVVKLPIKGRDGSRDWLYGRLQFIGRQGARRPKYFRVTFSDGSEDQFTLVKAKKYLCPADTVLPSSVHVLTISKLDYHHLPATWDLTSVDGLADALHLLMPGYDRSVATAVHAALGRLQAGAMLPTCGSAMVTAATAALFRYFNFSRYASVGGVWDIDRTFRTEFFQKTGIVMQSCVTPVEVQLQPAWHRSVCAAVDGYVCCAVGTLLDLLVPLMLMSAKRAVFMHVPQSYVTDALPARHRWLQRLHQQHCLVIVPSAIEYDVAAEATQWVWVAFFCAQATLLEDVQAPVALDALSLL